jgi:hypothetical protein
MVNTIEKDVNYPY